MLIVVDDVLSKESLEVVQAFFAIPASRDMQWVDGELETLLAFRSPLADILTQVARVFDLTSMSGVEQWAHHGTKPNWHIDKDETLAKLTGEIAMPICSIVFYADVQVLEGGKFMTDSIAITPKTNRLVAFGPGVRHGVEDYTGTRMAVAVNPWAAKPRGY